jgi:hypothetical protein
MPSTVSKKHIDYTEMEHHNELPDPNEENDISSPQGEFWHRNERPGADSIKEVYLEKRPAGETDGRKSVN